MAVVVVGMHERDVPLEVFERVAVTEQELHKALAALVAGPNLSEAVILSTCLRTEVYAAVDRFHDGVADIEAFFRARAGAGDGGVGAHAADGHSSGRGEPADGNERRPEAGGGVLELGGGLSCRYDDAAIAYLFEVAAGIDSPVLGEGENPAAGSRRSRGRTPGERHWDGARPAVPARCRGRQTRPDRDCHPTRHDFARQRGGGARSRSRPRF